MSNAHFIHVPELNFTRFEQKRSWLIAWYFGPFAQRQAVILQGDLTYYSAILEDVVVVKGGYRSDGASVPQLFWNLYPPFGEYLEAAIVHDHFCDLGAKGKSPISFFKAARLFVEAMEACNRIEPARERKTRPLQRALMFAAVVIGGPKFRAQKLTGLQPVKVNVLKPKKRWGCRRCLAEVIDGRCRCAQSPSPWEPFDPRLHVAHRPRNKPNPHAAANRAMEMHHKRTRD